MTRWRRWLPYVVVAGCVWQSAQQILVWRSNLTLWAHASIVAPHKPRVALNHGLVLLEAGEIMAGVQEMRRARALTLQAHVPAWDRRITREAVTVNLQALRTALTVR